jgi:hypothetical protein
MIEPEMGAGIDPSMALTLTISSSILNKARFEPTILSL